MTKTLIHLPSFRAKRWRNRLMQSTLAIATSIFVISISPLPVRLETKPQPQPTPTPQVQPKPSATPQPLPSLPTPLQGKQRIVMLGDSITQGGGQYGGYIWLLQRYLSRVYPEQKLEFVSAGVSGNTSSHLSERFKQDVLDQKPNLVAINVGINDALQSLQGSANEQGGAASLETYRQKLSAMVEAAQARNISVLLLSPTLIYEDLNSPQNLRLAQYINALREIANKYRCQFIDLNVPFRNVIMTYQRYGGKGQNLLTRDGIHPNTAGHQIMAYTILRGWEVPEDKIQNLRIDY